MDHTIGNWCLGGDREARNRHFWATITSLEHGDLNSPPSIRDLQRQPEAR